jgi:hypothetical protein
MADWKIDRRASTCRRCERAFEEGERFASCLSILGEDLGREDLCPQCWQGNVPGSPGELFWWFTRYEADRRRSVQLDLESLERLFLVLEGRRAPCGSCAPALSRALAQKSAQGGRIERSSAGESFVVKRPRRDERHQVFVFDFDATRAWRSCARSSSDLRRRDFEGRAVRQRRGGLESGSPVAPFGGADAVSEPTRASASSPRFPGREGERGRSPLAGRWTPGGAADLSARRQGELLSGASSRRPDQLTNARSVHR